MKTRLKLILFIPAKAYKGNLQHKITLYKAMTATNQCDQMWQFFALWATF